MPALPPVPNVIKAQLGWVLDLNDSAMAVLHFRYTGGPPAAPDCAAIAADIQAAAITNFRGQMVNLNKVGECRVVDIASNTGHEGVGGTASAGTKAGNPNPASTCLVMNHHIARRYRGGKPRTYLPVGVNADLNSTGTWLGAFQTTMTTAWSNFITTCLAASSGGTSLTDFVSVSYYGPSGVRPSPVVDVVFQSTARQRLGTQRRRNATA
jgi:hypothetical protein